MKKALVITYYWPPSGGAGVQRWLKFVKYLREFGWEPIVYTPENPESPETDESLFKDIPSNIEVLRTKIWEPYLLYKKFIGRKKDDKIKAAFLAEKKSNPVTENISVWIRGNFFIPDARKYWIRPSVKFLRSYIGKNPVDLLISTGPPHSMHMIARKVAEECNLPWIADFRDPWTNIDFYPDLKLTGPADRKHHRLEKEVLQYASAVITVGKTMAEDFNRICKRNYHVITNGYDENDIPISPEYPGKKKFRITHVGSLVSARNPVSFWKAIRILTDEIPEFGNELDINLVGRIDVSVLETAESFLLTKLITRTDYLPHDRVIGIQQQSHVLLLLINNSPNAKSILTGKFFEYLASGRTILCIGPPDGDAAEILKETGAGLVSDFDDVVRMKENILMLYRDFKAGKINAHAKDIEKYSRKHLTRELAKIMDSIT